MVRIGDQPQAIRYSKVRAGWYIEATDTVSFDSLRTLTTATPRQLLLQLAHWQED